MLRILYATLLCGVLLIAGCGSQKSAPELKIGIIPYEDPNKIIDDYSLFGDYLARAAGEKSKIFVSPSYMGIGQALMADQIDCAYLNPLSYVLFADKMKGRSDALIPLAMPHVHGSLYYYGAIFVRADSGITSVAQLKGKRMAFGEASSTSGFIYPYAYFKAHGLNPDKDFAATMHAPVPMVVPAVINGSADAGAVYEEALTNPRYISAADQKSIRVLARVGPIANGMFVVRGDEPPAVIAGLKAAFAKINTDPAAQPALTKMGTNMWETANDAAFDPVRVTAREIGLDISSLDEKKKQ